MRVKNTTQRFEVFVQEMQESIGGGFRGRTRETLQKLLESDSEQQTAEHLALKWHKRAVGAVGRIDYRNGFYERAYVTPLGLFANRAPFAMFLIFRSFAIFRRGELFVPLRPCSRSN
jgi:hypothetical protein